MFLSVPRQDVIPGVDTRPSTLREWLDGLPYTEIGNTADRLLERLTDINHQILPGPQRYELMLEFNRAFTRLHEGLRHPARAQDRLPASSLQLLDALTEQLLFGYKYIINGAPGERRLWGRPRHLFGAINYAAQLTTLLLACRYQAYLPTDPTLWSEAGLLQQLAESESVPPTPDADFPFSPGQLGAASAYKLLGLLRLADPYHLPADRVWDILQYLCPRIEAVVHYRVGADHKSRPGELALCMNCDASQAVRPGHDNDSEEHSWLMLDVNPLLEDLQADLARLKAGSSPRQLGLSDHLLASDARQLLNHLLAQWQQQPPERKLPRVDSDAPVRVAVGLEAAFALHNGNRPFNPADYLAFDDEDEIDLGYPLEAGNAGPAKPPETLRCATLNRSAGGLALHLLPEGRLKLSVGQLLSIQNPSGEWLAGAVRWEINHPESGIEAGVQYIAKDAFPVAVRPLTGDVKTRFQPALGTLINHEGQRYLILIGPKGLYREQRTLEMDIDGERKQVRCLQLLEANASFERFIYEDI
ncbi:hypothetical protein QVG61_03255 [Thiohalobacter sp. IOR34]|uniref:hypothetical protein n=1 Tax=Thiohalobacter sp. IOR34 TaxID=3057176 RepID=UPI0025AEF1A2|nr:hypothetical protein [Thiohalobacter sp. IOR34]WJW76124.1 hypothetical protein QVG61_03255 [Thiohalobacter sp. IOR34]